MRSRPAPLTLALLGAVLSLTCLVPAGAQELRGGGQLRSRGPAGSPAARKVVSPLRALAADMGADGVVRENAGLLDAPRRYSVAGLRVDEEARVQVYVTVTDAGEATLAALGRHGLEVEVVNAERRTVQGWVPVDALEALAGEPAVVKIRPPSYARSNAGAAAGEGDAIHRCADARAAGFTGAGIKVGVISDGVDSLAASQASGDLPAVQVLVAGTGDEGTAMLEIVHDCAPGAPLAYAASGDTSLTMIDAVNGLIAAGSRIVVDDKVFFREPQFEDGLLAQNDRVAGTQALRVASSGNRGRAHYQAVFFSNGGAFPDFEVAPGFVVFRHHFAPGDTQLRFTVPGGATATLVLQWGNRFGQAADDYDLCVRDVFVGQIVACSATEQNGDDDPFEQIILPCNPGSDCFGDLQVTIFQGNARLLDVRCYQCVFDEYNDPVASIDPGHAAVPEVLTVGAVLASDPDSLDPQSARGPAVILFPAQEIRTKVDVAGVDGVTTTVPGFNPFFGTSAAAPQVGAVAALVLEKNPTLTPAALREVLRQSAIDLGPAGPDVAFGSGRADAVQALAAVQAPPSPTAVVRLTLNQTLFRTGQTLVATASVIPGTDPAPVDGYVVIRLPDGLTHLSVLVGSVVPKVEPIVRGFSPVAIAPVEVLRYTFTGVEPPGDYTFISGFAQPGSLIQVGNLDQDIITFLP